MSDDLNEQLGKLALMAETANHWTDEHRLMPAAGVADIVYDAIQRIEELEAKLTVAYMYGVRDSSKRIKLLEQRVIDLQGHDDLSYIDKKLSEQEEVERLRAKKKQIYEDLKDGVEREWVGLSK